MKFWNSELVKSCYEKLNFQEFIWLDISILLPFSAYDFNYPLQLKQELITVEVTPEITNFDEGD